MVAKTETKTESKAPAKKKIERPQAVADDLDLNTAMEDEEFPVSVRRSKWTEILDKLYAATENDQVPRGEDTSLKFIRLGAFSNPNGARTQKRAMEAKGLGETYEFKAIGKGAGSELWGRVIEVDA
jgi:hypothetical protein